MIAEVGHYFGLKQYKRDLKRKLRQNLVPISVQSRMKPPRAWKQLLGSAEPELEIVVGYTATRPQPGE